MSGTVLVLGVTGRIGRRVATRLAAAGLRPRALVRDPRSAADRLGPLASGVDLVTGSMDDPATLPAALAGVERVFLMSPIDPHMQALQQHVVDAIGQGDGIRHVVKLSGSTWTLDPDFPTASGGAHAAIEDALGDIAARRGFTVTPIRPGVFIDGFLQAALQRLVAAVTARPGEAAVLAMPTADAAVAYVDPDAIAEVAARTLLAPAPAGGIIEVSYPEARTGDAVAIQAGALLGVPVRFQPLSLAQVLAAQGDRLSGFQRLHVTQMLTGIASGRAARPADPPLTPPAGLAWPERLSRILASAAEPR